MKNEVKIINLKNLGMYECTSIEVFKGTDDQGDLVFSINSQFTDSQSTSGKIDQYAKNFNKMESLFDYVLTLAYGNDPYNIKDDVKMGILTIIKSHMKNK